MFPEVLARLSDDWLGIRRTALGELVCALEAGALSVNQRQQILQKVSERWARFDGPLVRNLCLQSLKRLGDNFNQSDTI